MSELLTIFEKNKSCRDGTCDCDSCIIDINKYEYGKPFEPNCPCVIPKNHEVIKCLVNVSDFSASFYNEFPWLKNVDVIIAGGMPLSFITEYLRFTDKLIGSNKIRKHNDIDCFLITNENDDFDEKLNAVVKHIISNIELIPYRNYRYAREQYPKEINVYLMQGLCKITWHYRDRNHNETTIDHFEIQIIMRKYTKGIPQILLGFDIPSCAIAFDGNTLWSTKLGAYAITNMINIVDPENSSVSTPLRVGKYYERGFGLALPNLKIPSEIKNIELKHMILNVNHITNGMLHASMVVFGKENVASDYDDHKHEFFQTYINTRKILQGQSSLCCKITNINEFDIKKLNKVSDIMDINEYTYYLTRMYNGLVRKNKFNIDYANIFDIKCAEYESIINLKEQIVPQKYIDMYEKMKDEQVEWVIKIDPGKQYTGSKHPVSETIEEWYKTENYSPTIISANYIDGMKEWHEKYSPKSKFLLTICPICHDTIIPGEKNTCILRCGHNGHMLPQDGCPGIIKWLSISNTTCPMCRSNHW